MDFKLQAPCWGTQTCVIGIEHKSGSYEGHDYDFNLVHGVSVKHTELGDILVTETFKAKKGICRKLPAELFRPYSLNFDRNGNVVSFDLIEGKE